MNKKYPVMWFQGASVGPEIFQQEFLYTEYNIKSLFKNMLPFFWGINSISIDETELPNGILKLQKLTGVNVDFSLIDIDSEDDLQINLTLFKEELKNQTLFLYLSFPNNDYTEQSNVSNPKYNEIIKEVHDLNNKEEKIELKFIKTKYFLEIGKTTSLKNISMPIGKLTYNGMTYKFIDYCVPTFNINNCDLITNSLKNLISLMKDKVNFLKMTKNNLENYSLLSNVSIMLFSLEKCLKCNVHPYELYNSLITCISCAFTFSKSSDLPNILEYKHDNILETVKELVLYISDNIKAITVTCIQKQFEKQATQTMTLFSIDFPIKIENNTIIIGIERNKAAEYQDMQKWIEDAIIATSDKISDTQSQRALGAKRKLIKNIEELNIPKLENMIILGIETNNQFITKDQPICILNFDEKTPAPEAIYLIEN